MTETTTLTFTRALPAPPARVFTALTSAADRMVWGPPDTGHVVLIEGQPAPAPGVREISRCGPADNPYVTVSTDWVLLDPTCITYAETLEAEGTVLGTSLAVFDLMETAHGTDLSATIIVASYVGPEIFPEVEGGWTHALRNLESHLSGQPQ